MYEVWGSSPSPGESTDSLFGERERHDADSAAGGPAKPPPSICAGEPWPGMKSPIDVKQMIQEAQATIGGVDIYHTDKGEVIVCEACLRPKKMEDPGLPGSGETLQWNDHGYPEGYRRHSLVCRYCDTYKAKLFPHCKDCASFVAEINRTEEVSYLVDILAIALPSCFAATTLYTLVL